MGAAVCFLFTSHVPPVHCVASSKQLCTQHCTSLHPPQRYTSRCGVRSVPVGNGVIGPIACSFLEKSSSIKIIAHCNSSAIHLYTYIHIYIQRLLPSMIVRYLVDSFMQSGLYTLTTRYGVWASCTWGSNP